MTGFVVMSRRCDQCLLDPVNRIVPSRRAARLLAECAQKDTPFLCHKGAGRDIACRGHHDVAPSRNSRLSDWLGLSATEIDPETLLPVPRR